MPRYLAALAIVLLLGTVLTRVGLLKRRGVTAMKFGELDPTDFLIPPVAFFYFYSIFAHVFDWPTLVRGEFFDAIWVAWMGVLLCAAGLALMVWSLVSFGKSFRIGIDTDRPDKLVTSGVFAFTRNPIYVAFAFVLLGECLIWCNLLTAIYFLAAIALFHRQVLREEGFLREHYGSEYQAYSERVRRYL